METRLAIFAIGFDNGGTYVHVDAQHHLRDLQSCDGHADGLGNSDSHSSQSIVAVHEGMDCIVHHHEPSASCGMVGVAVPDVNQDGDMVVPMQEYQLLLSEYNKHSIPQLVHFGDCEHVGPNCRGSICIGRVTYGKVYTKFPNDVK